MGKRFLLLMLIIILILSAGCDLIPINTNQENPTDSSGVDINTLSAMIALTNANPTGLPQLPTITATANQEVTGQGGDQPTKTPLPGSIKITGITQKSAGVAQVTWETSGDFPSGFKVVFTDQQGQPTYPENTYSSVGSSTARSAVINYTADRIYYVRVCRFLYGACDIYSDLGIFAFAPPTATPKPTKTPGSVVVNGTVVPYDSTLVITLIKGGSSGKAYIEWTDKGSTSNGYKIVYSTSSQTPVYGTDSYFYIADSNARSAYLDGSSETKYYYRICRYNGSTCTSYSAVYTFTFPTYTNTDSSVINITSVTDTGTGVAQVNWTATGTFDNGFKILYSKTNSLPTLADSVTVVSDGTARLGSISGDPSSLYHIRVCKYSGSDCTVYSPVQDFIFAADPAVITITGLADGASAGEIDLEWTATGSYPNGFKLLYSSNAVPDLSNSSVVTAASGATTGTITGAAATHYYMRLCKSLGSTCGVYSNTVQLTTATTGIVLAANVTPSVFDWTLTPDVSNTDGYHLFWTTGKLAPVWAIGLDQQAAIAADRTLTFAPALSTGHYILRLCYWNTLASNCTAYSNTVEVDIP